MISVLGLSEGFPKSARLLSKRDFRFQSYQRVISPDFILVRGSDGRGRLGISISKRVLRRANARNRVRRLIKEAFRLNRIFFKQSDLHVIGADGLAASWDRLSVRDVQGQLLLAVKQ